MDPELQKLMMQLLEKVKSGGLADTLTQLTGGVPPKYGLVPEDTPSNVLAQFVRAEDRIEFSPQTLLSQKVSGFGGTDRALSHEMGHRLWDKSKKAPKDTAYATVDNEIFDLFMKKIHSQSELGQRDYLRRGISSNLELGAEAFAEAVDFFRKQAQKVPDEDDIYEDIAWRDKHIPGTMQMVDYLMKKPIYQQHPVVRYLALKPVFNKAGAKPDVAAVTQQPLSKAQQWRGGGAF